MARFDRRLLYHFDWTLFFLVAALAGVGLVSIASGSYAGPRHPLDPRVYHQLVWAGAGGAMMLSAAFFDYRRLASYSYLIYSATVVLLAIVSVAGHATGGSRRWINVGLFELEPSELAKIAMVLVLVNYVGEAPPPGGWRLRHMIIPALLIGLPALLVMKQPDLGTALILVLAGVTLIFASGMSLRTMASLVLAVLLAAPLSWRFLKPYQRERVTSFLNPYSDPLGAGYHIIQSEIAIGAGGSVGEGLLKATQARLNFLPQQTTDFIFSVYAEEFGFAGSILLLALYGALVARGFWIARHARDRLGSLLAVGLTALVFWQVAVNVGMATGLLPVVGITLPLVSYGGSSLIVVTTSMGILINIRRRRYVF